MPSKFLSRRKADHWMVSALRAIFSSGRSKSDSYTATGTGVSPTVTVDGAPLAAWSMTVKGTGAAASAWDVRLQVSNDGSNFTEIITHVNGTDADGAMVGSEDFFFIATAFRVNVNALTLGSATNIIVTVRGVPLAA